MSDIQDRLEQAVDEVILAPEEIKPKRKRRSKKKVDPEPEAPVVVTKEKTGSSNHLDAVEEDPKSPITAEGLYRTPMMTRRKGYRVVHY